MLAVESRWSRWSRGGRGGVAVVAVESRQDLDSRSGDLRWVISRWLCEFVVGFVRGLARGGSRWLAVGYFAVVVVGFCSTGGVGWWGLAP
uniref:Transmembrane protein n=1 Tax=Fagus sylvatica TaxID=28930 RepID=A0A2N9ILY2_FAGSY